MTRFIEITDVECGVKMIINVNKIIYVCPKKGKGTYLRCAESDSVWAVISTAESYDEICEMIRKVGGTE